MKTRIISTIIGIAICTATFAQSEMTEKTVVNKPEKVTITRKNEKVSIAIEGKDGNPEYRYYNQFVVNDDATETINETEDKREWNFSFPFDGKIANKNNSRVCNNQKRGKRYHEPNFAGFGVGMVTALNATDGMEVDMSASYEFAWQILSFHEEHRSSKRWNSSIGFGLNWRNYRMTSRQRFIQSGEQLIVGNYPEAANPDFSRIKIFSIMVPFAVSYSFDKHTDLQFGPIVNFNTYASVKTRYNTDSGSKKDFFKGIHQRHVTLDLQMKLSYHDISIYTKYTPFSPLGNNYGPSFQGLSVGMMLSY